VFCENGHVVQLTMNGFLIPSGALIPEFGFFPMLRMLDLTQNSFTGLSLLLLAFLVNVGAMAWYGMACHVMRP
jgi:hypothetical protein